MLILRYVPLHLSVSLVLGILLGFRLRFLPDFNPWLMALLFLLVLSGWLVQERSFQFGFLFFVSVHLFMAYTGYCLVRRDLPGGRQRHYLNHYTEGDLYSLKLGKELKGYQSWKRFEAVILRVGDKTANGRVLVSLSLSPMSKPLSTGDLIYTVKHMNDIIWSGNPGSFDFRGFAERRGMIKQVYLKDFDYAIAGRAEPTLFSRASAWNRECRRKLESLSLSDESASLLKALLLGDRSELPDELSEGFRKAGAAHVLALSGLHVGILIGMLRILLLPFTWLRPLKWFAPLFEVGMLWIFALFTGLSASVVRAVGMYSAYRVSTQGQGALPAGSAMLLALFIMLLTGPMNLFDLGFQLSFSAVAGIAMFYPVLKDFWMPARLLFRYPVGLLYVSLSAQLGVLPLSLTYFHQFSGHFLLSSLVLIPFLGILVPFGLLLLLFSFFLSVPEPMTKSLDFFVFLMHEYVEGISGIKFLQWEQVYFPAGMAPTLYGLIIVLFLIMRRVKMPLLVLLLLFAVLLEIQVILARIEFRNSEELMVAQLPKKSMITFRRGNDLQLFRGANDKEESSHGTLKNYLLTMPAGAKIDRGEEGMLFSMEGLVRLVGRDHLVLEDRTETEIVVLFDSPRIHLGKLIRCYKPKLIVADGSNYPSFVKRWRKTCKQYGVRFYDTREKGAFVYRPD